MAAMVTGGTGLLGRSLVQRLLDEERVVVLSNDPWPGPRSEKLTEILGDIRDYDTVLKSCRGIDHVFHLAAQLPISELPTETVWSVNVDGTRNVLEASFNSKVKRVVHISSSSVYGLPSQVPCFEDSPQNPIGVYGRSKVMAEKICMEYVKKGLDVVVLRPMTIIGPGMKGVFLILFNWVKEGRRIYLVGDGSNRIQMISVSDLVEACMLAAQETRVTGQVMNIGSDDVPTVRKLMESLIRHARSTSRIVPMNAGFVSNILRLLRLAGASPLVAEHYFLADKDFILDTGRAKSLLSWRPSLSNVEMLNEAYDWYATNAEAIRLPEQGILRLVKLLS